MAEPPQPAAPATSPAAPSEAKSIRNYATWKDTKGNLIDCHEGGILRVGPKYYWYGRAYHGDDRGIYGAPAATFRCGLNCYSSENLVDWTYEGAALAYPESGWITEGTWHRPRVLFNQKTGKFVLWFFCLGAPIGDYHVRDVVAIADKPAGPFKIVGSPNLGLQPSGDLALLQDADGKGFMANGDVQRNGLIFRLSDDFQKVAEGRVNALPAGDGKRYEGLSLARFKGKYLIAGSGVEHGLDPSDTTYAVADAPLGPYVVKGLMSEQKTWRSQISSFCLIPETDTLFALCEQWLLGPDGQPAIAERSTQLWLPIALDPKTGIAKMLPLKQWDPRQAQK